VRHSGLAARAFCANAHSASAAKNIFMQFPLRAKLPEAKISRPDRRYLHGTLRKRFTGLIAEVDAPDSAGIAMRFDQ
jgi:hypothetical protein